MSGNETTRRLNLVECLVFMAIGALVGSIITYLVQIRSQPSTRIEAAEVNYGMSKAHIRGMLGQPDDIEIVLPGESASFFDEIGDSVQREVWGYGPFGAYRSHNGWSGHTTKYRLLVMFVEDYVVEWTTSAPLDEQQHQR
jgi:hypothetical protein